MRVTRAPRLLSANSVIPGLPVFSGKMDGNRDCLSRHLPETRKVEKQITAMRSVFHLFEPLQQIAGVDREMEENPADPGLHLRRAELHRAHGDPEAAREDLRSALEMNPRDGAALLTLARLERETGRLSAALEAVEAFLQEHADDPIAWEEKGRIHAAAGEWTEAANSWQRCLSVSKDPEPGTVGACADALCRAGSPRRALEALNDAIGRHPRVIPLRQRAAVVHIGLDEHKAADRHFDALLAFYPNLRVRLLVEEADIWRRHGHAVESRDSYEDALAALSSLSPARRSRPGFRELSDLIDQALASLESPEPMIPR